MRKLYSSFLKRTMKDGPKVVKALTLRGTEEKAINILNNLYHSIIEYEWALPKKNIGTLNIAVAAVQSQIDFIYKYGGSWCGYLSTGGTWVQRHSGHTVGPPPLGDTGIDPTVGCICYHTSLPSNTGRLGTGNKNFKSKPVVLSLGSSESNMKMV